MCVCVGGDYKVWLSADAWCCRGIIYTIQNGQVTVPLIGQEPVVLCRSIAVVDDGHPFY